MVLDRTAFEQFLAQLGRGIQLVAVSKIQAPGNILTLYEYGQKDFGENYVQELVDKYEQLPKDIRWHFIGHLQSNKVKFIAPFVYLIHGVDSEKLLVEINKQAVKNSRVIDCLLQVHIATEDTKFGMNEEELANTIANCSGLKNVKIVGLMGMASFSEDVDQVRKEFKYLKLLFEKYKATSSENVALRYLSMGMSNDYKMAVEEGSNMVRIGSLIFGARPTF